MAGSISRFGSVQLHQFLFVNTTHIPAYATLVVGVLANPRSLEVVRHFITRPRTRYVLVWRLQAPMLFVFCTSIALGCGGLRQSGAVRNLALTATTNGWEGTEQTYEPRTLLARLVHVTVVLPILVFRVQRCVPFSPSFFRCSCSRRRRPSPQSSVVRSSAAPGEP